jgi:hypothetical protein
MSKKKPNSKSSRNSKRNTGSAAREAKSWAAFKARVGETIAFHSGALQSRGDEATDCCRAVLQDFRDLGRNFDPNRLLVIGVTATGCFMEHGEPRLQVFRRYEDCPRPETRASANCYEIHAVVDVPGSLPTQRRYIHENSPDAGAAVAWASAAFRRQEPEASFIRIVQVANCVTGREFDCIHCSGRVMGREAEKTAAVVTSETFDDLADPRHVRTLAILDDPNGPVADSQVPPGWRFGGFEPACPVAGTPVSAN